MAIDGVVRMVTGDTGGLWLVAVDGLLRCPPELRGTMGLGEIQEQVVAVGPQTPLADLQRLDPDEVVRVVDGDRLLGLITGYDVARSDAIGR